MRGSLRSVLAAVVLLGLSACGSTPVAAPKSTGHPSTSPSAVVTAPTPGSCRNLTYSAAAGNSDSTPTVSCSSKHTAVTVAVGSLVDQQHPTVTNVNSSAIQQRLIGACKKDVNAYVGGSPSTYALSLVQAIWFLPTPEQITAGARWYRCDLVVLAGQNKLAPLPRTIHHALARPHALNQWGTCGNAAPSSPKFRRQLCSSRHRWRAVAIVTLPAKAAYLSKATSARASKTCGNVAARNAAGALKYTWSFEWPNQQQWKAGQRYGLCWLPQSN